jgi:site-specific DNA recombinase
LKKDQLVIYCRVSTVEQVENYSLETQEKTCREWAAKNGYSIAAVYVEEGESAKTTNRPKFQQAISFCLKHRKTVGVILVYKMNRFARNAADQTYVDSFLHRYGISVRSATEHFDDSSAGNLMKNMLASFNQFDNDLRGENTLSGMKAALMDGIFPWKAPAGFLSCRTAEGQPTLSHDPQRAPLIKRAFELFSTGNYSQRKVLEVVTSEGLRTRSGKRVSPQTFNAWMRNPIYAGILFARKWGIRSKGNFPPVVPEEMFNKVQAILDGKRQIITAYKKNHPDFPLRNFVRCKGCGKPLTASWSRGRSSKYAYYRCPKGCVTVRREQMEKIFVEALERLTLSDDHLQLFKSVVEQTWERKHGEAEKLASETKSGLQIVKRRKNLLLDALLDGRIKQQDYSDRMEALDAEIENLENRLAESEIDELDVQAVIRFAEKVLHHPSVLWSNAELDNKQRLQKLYFPDGLNLNEEGGFGTAKHRSIFNDLDELMVENSKLASPTGFEPVLSP